MDIWAIGDLHLSFGTPNKSMGALLPLWENHEKQIQEAWDSSVKATDIVIIPGDISWAMRLSDALSDFAYIAERPGIKVIIKGNHDYWWDSPTKLRKTLPHSIHIIQNDVFTHGPVTIAGARLWESNEYSFSSIIDVKGEPAAFLKESASVQDNEKIFERELGRLEMSLKQIPKTASIRIAATHFPPIGLNLDPSRASSLFEAYRIQYAIFGHLHSIRSDITSLFGARRGIEYILSSADWLHFTPKKICSV